MSSQREIRRMEFPVDPAMIEDQNASPQEREDALDIWLEGWRDLCRLELLSVPGRCGMTYQQALAWGMRLDGMSYELMAECMHVSRPVAWEHLLKACQKAITLQHSGVLTALIEEFGISHTLEAMSR